MYPRHLFKAPGPYRSVGRAYDVAGATNEAEEAKLLAKGWFLTREEAWGVPQAEALIEQAEELEEAIDEISPATRDELEQKAKELGVPFNSRTKDETLTRRIAEAM